MWSETQQIYTTDDSAKYGKLQYIGLVKEEYLMLILG